MSLSEAADLLTLSTSGARGYILVRARLAGRQDLETHKSFGYKQDLRRSLRYFVLFGISFSVISITTGIFLAFGSALSDLGLVAIWEWLVVGIGQIFRSRLSWQSWELGYHLQAMRTNGDRASVAQGTVGSSDILDFCICR